MAIRWTKSDIAKLGRAVKDFNRIVDKLEALNENAIIPSKLSYEDLRRGENEILTRRELNRLLNSINRFKMPENQEIITKGEINLTRWEDKELAIQSRNLSREINKQLDIEKAQKYGVEYISPKSRRGQTLLSQKIRASNRYSSSMKNFLNIRKMLKNFERSDRKIQKDILFKENYLKMFKTFSEFSGYYEMLEFLEGMAPSEFAHYILAHDKFNSISEMYLIAQGNDKVVQAINQEQFNEIRSRYGNI